MANLIQASRVLVNDRSSSPGPWVSKSSDSLSWLPAISCRNLQVLREPRVQGFLDLDQKLFCTCEL